MQHGTVRYQVIGALVVLAALVMAVPALMSLREEPAAPVRSIALPQEPATGMAATVDEAGNTPPGTLPELTDIPLPDAPPAPDLEPIPPAPPPTIPGAGAPAAPAASAAPGTTPAPAGATPAPSAPAAPTAAAPAPTSPAPAAPVAPGARSAAPAPGPVASAMPAPRPVPGAPAVGVQSYIVQLGTFVNRDGAQSVHDRLRGAGFRVFTEETLVNGKAALRVRVGPELDRSAAENQRERIARELGLEGVVLRYQ